MSTEEDKYPVESERRRFVKGVVGAGAVAGLGATGAAAINTSTPPAGAGGGVRDFMGIELTGGPAPRGMPQIPVEVADDGTISGYWPEVVEVEVEGETVNLAEEEIGGIEYSSEWFHYCGVQTSPAVLPAADRNNEFLSDDATQYEWQQELEGGEPLNIEHFDDYEEWGNEIGSDGIGKPAMATWRSEDLGPGDELTVLVFRSSLIEEAAQDDEWLSETTHEGVFAILNVCTHFCCIPGYKLSETAERIGAGDGIFCQCHQSIYDPFEIFEQTFVAFPLDPELQDEGEDAVEEEGDDEEEGDEGAEGEEGAENGNGEGDGEGEEGEEGAENGEGGDEGEGDEEAA